MERTTMKRIPILLLVSVLVAASGGAEKTAPPGEKPKPSAKKDAPLLLLDDEPEAKPAAGKMADNSRCHVCHLNYEKEELALTHAKEQIGCAKCHGASDRHIDDESWTWGGKGTPPDTMFPREKVNPFCMTCHDMSKVDADEHECPYPAMNPKKTCTDCHGKHRLANRKCKWK
jgi:hypothetical protein